MRHPARPTGKVPRSPPDLALHAPGAECVREFRTPSAPSGWRGPPLQHPVRPPTGRTRRDCPGRVQGRSAGRSVAVRRAAFRALRCAVAAATPGAWSPALVRTEEVRCRNSQGPAPQASAALSVVPKVRAPGKSGSTWNRLPVGHRAQAWGAGRSWAWRGRLPARRRRQGLPTRRRGRAGSPSRPRRIARRSGHGPAGPVQRPGWRAPPVIAAAGQPSPSCHRWRAPRRSAQSSAVVIANLLRRPRARPARP
ncbi:hypothetical protein EV655_1122 [Rhodovulum euryhalinum]|uniref:Uncharacterized protein n=1 Tax=Rhodovulum euryhalinum TaxID=35805 RepID=A0A4R2KHB7_9RHOB|nr:hypothetical protein EV655_1122 [Rhodovulum euryhalinum]